MSATMHSTEHTVSVSENNIGNTKKSGDLLNANELTVLKVLYINAQNCSGGDFAMSDESDLTGTGITKKQYSGYVSSLDKKRMISVTHDHVNGRTPISQITFTEAGAKAIDVTDVQTFG